MNAQENNRLTLEGIAKRLAALERENAELRHKVVTLEGSGTRQAKLPALRRSDTGRDGESVPALDAQVSRRALLSKAGAAAVAAAAAGTLLNAREAKANHSEVVLHAEYVITHTLLAEGETDSSAVVARRTADGHGVRAEGRGSMWAGVFGDNITGTGVKGQSYARGYEGVYGQHMGEGYGVVGDGYGSGFAGVLGRNNNGPGLQGEGGPGVWGRATKEGHPAVLGDRGPDGTPGEGVAGVGVGEGFGNAGVRGRNWDGGGFGVIGDGGAHAGGVFGRNAFESGTGVVGVATESIGGIGVSGRGQDAGVRGDSANGYGGRFAGGKAQLMLTPGGAVGRPTGDHTKGEIYMDSAGALFVCTADGSPGTWKKVTTTLAP